MLSQCHFFLIRRPTGLYYLNPADNTKFTMFQLINVVIVIKQINYLLAACGPFLLLRFIQRATVCKVETEYLSKRHCKVRTKTKQLRNDNKNSALMSQHYCVRISGRNILGSLNSQDDDSYENVTSKHKSMLSESPVLRDYPNLFSLYSVTTLFRNCTGKDFFQVEKENRQKTLPCSRSPQKL